MTVFFDLKINGVSQGVISNDPNIYTVPASFIVPNPPLKAKYELSVKFDYLLTNVQLNGGIVGTTALPIYTDSSTQFSYASVKQFANTVTQNPSTKDLPLAVDFTLQSSNVGANQCLSASWTAPDSDKMSELKLSVIRYEIQLIRGIAGTAPTGFDNTSLLSLNSNGNKTLLVEANIPSNGGSSDPPEYTLLKVYTGGVVTELGTGVYSSRMRVVVSSDSGEITSDWTITNYEKLEKAMSAPSSVTVTSALSPPGSTGSSVSVNYTSVATANITGKPESWSGAKAIAAKISLFDQGGKIVSGPTTKPFTDAEITAAPNGAYTSSAIISGLPTGSTVYARVGIVYVRLTSDGVPIMNDLKEGAQTQSASYSIKSNVTIKTVKLRQSPISSSARGLDPNGGTSFNVEADLVLGNNDSSSVLVKVVAPGLVGGTISHVHEAVYDSVKKVWNTTLTPVPSYDYAKNQLTVFAISPQNMDTISV
jgi:hypothetical protein